MLIYFWLLFVFVIGISVGSFLNVAIARLPLEKSLIWPGSHCGKCVQAIRWYDNIPLLSYIWLRGRCRSCGERYSIGYFAVELLTGLGFVGLFYLEVVRNIHDWPVPVTWGLQFGIYPWTLWAGFTIHAVLFTFLMAASGCDLNGRTIPLEITFLGMLIGLVGAVLMPWPWPWGAEAAMPRPRGFDSIDYAWIAGAGLRVGVVPWPVWGPLPEWLPPGSWQLGLATGLGGMLMGTLLLRAVAFLFGRSLGKEGLGLGDADLMMMVGSFLGWQVVVVAFFLSALPALCIGILQLAIRRDNSLPFGPSLAAGTMLTLLCWGWLGPFVQPLFFWGTFMLILAGMGAAILVVCGLLMRLLRMAATRA